MKREPSPGDSDVCDLTDKQELSGDVLQLEKPRQKSKREHGTACSLEKTASELKDNRNMKKALSLFKHASYETISFPSCTQFCVLLQQ